MASATAAHVGRARLREHALRCDDAVPLYAAASSGSRRHLRRRASLHRSAHGSGPRSCDVPRARGGGAEQGWRLHHGIRADLTGQIAVRTLGGRQIAYADVTDSGRARMFSRGCL
jgi:hypothetical protein